MNDLTVFTIGHSTHSLHEFIALLERHAMTSLVDIRRYPSSRKFPHFNREPLQTALNAAGITYCWCEALGGRRHRAKDAPPSPNPGLRHESFRNYADYMLTAEFRRAVAWLLPVAAAERTAIMCAEALFWQCHRRLVSDYLVAIHGVTVQHIFPNGTLKPHTLTRGAAVAGGTLMYPESRPLFDGNECE